MEMVNFLSMFCPELQKLLKPIYNLTRKGRQFIWEKEQQSAFEEIKCRLVRSLILHMPNCEGGFHLYLDTSKFAMGSTLYQIQNGKQKLIAYARLEEAVRNYLITELELCGLAVNVASSLHLLKRVDFVTVVYYLALTHIIKSKAKLATTRIERLLELISSYSFNLYYIKGKDMILSDFLSRQRHDNSDPHDIIPVPFNMHNVLQEKYYNLGMMDRYLVQTQSQTKSSGIKLPEVHGIKKTLDTNSLPERQVKINPKIKPRLGQGRAGIKCKKKTTL